MPFYGDATDDILGEDLNEAVIEDQEGDENENADDKKVSIKIEPKKRSVRNPRPRLTIDILSGPRGIHTIENYFKDIKFHGKGHEKKDLQEILRRLQHWAHRMYPNYNFDDILKNIERLGKKKQLQHHMNRYRQGLLEQNNEQKDIDDDDEHNERNEPVEDEPFDEFDALLGEQIAISKLAPKTPSHRNDISLISSVLDTPRFAEGNAIASTPHLERLREDCEPPVTPIQLPEENPPHPPPSKLTTEQMAKIAENRQLAQQKLKAKREAVNVIE